MFPKHFLLLLTLVLLLVLPFPATAQAGDCDGTPNNDVINCNINPITPENIIQADLGDDEITFGSGRSALQIFADGRSGTEDQQQLYGEGDGGNDVITNNGFVGEAPFNVSNWVGIIAGDHVTGAGGADTITNNGTAHFIFGDSAASGANDTITNNGLVRVRIAGDQICCGGDGGSDTIVNNAGGTVSDIFGDAISEGNRGGDDIIINAGTVSPYPDSCSWGSIAGINCFGATVVTTRSLTAVRGLYQEIFSVI
jgi:hypothetical protein